MSTQPAQLLRGFQFPTGGIFALTFHNTGDVRVESGTLKFGSFSQATHTSSTVTVASGAELFFEGGTHDVDIEIELPEDGVYTLRVRSPVSMVAQGNYRTGVFDAAVDVNRLVFNQPYFGQTDSPFGKDRWSFTSPAGTTIALDVFHPVSDNVLFTLSTGRITRVQ